MTESTIPVITREEPAGRRPRRWPRRMLLAAAVAVALLAGVAIGSGSQSGMLSRDRAEIASLHGQVSGLSSQAASLRSQAVAADAKAAGAQGTADAAARQAYASRNAALDQQAATLKQQQDAFAAEAGQLKASEISADGVYVVGSDIKPGTWHTAGDGGQGGNQCYFATLNSTSTNDIADNNNFDGPETVTLGGVRAFEINGGCTWARTGS